MLAAIYPGIPSDYTGWPEWLKADWIGHIPYAVGYRSTIEQGMDATSATGYGQRVTAVTGDAEAGEKAEIAAKLAEARARLDRHAS